MSKYIFSCGNGDIPMENRAYANVQTTQAKNICIGIESSGIPYSANFTDKGDYSVPIIIPQKGTEIAASGKL